LKGSQTLSQRKYSFHINPGRWGQLTAGAEEIPIVSVKNFNQKKKKIGNADGTGRLGIRAYVEPVSGKRAVS
jgi:hypothetical protein